MSTDPNSDLIERLLRSDISPPHERLTKAELWDWINEHVTLVNSVRSILLKSFAYQIANMALHSPPTEEQDDFDSIN